MGGRMDGAAIGQFRMEDAPVDAVALPGSPGAPLVEGAVPGGSGTWTVAVVVAGLMVVEGIRQGGFWHADASIVAMASVPLIVVSLATTRLRRPELALVGSVLLLGVWWLDRAHAAGSMGRFLPFGASILGFLAAFLATRALSPARKEVAAAVVALVGAGTALLGFVGLVWRWDPLAMPSQYLWRLSSSMTYADAAGLVLALGLIMALGIGRWPRMARASACLCAGGLLATQSRGPMLAFACACALVPLDRYRRNAVPLVAGLGVGLVAVATSASNGPVPLLGVAVAVAVVVSVARLPGRGPRPLGRRRVVLVAVVGCVAVLACVAVLHRQIELRVLAPSNGDRSVEWSTALDQFGAAPLVGVGPDQPLEFRAVDGNHAYFVHNEYLQIGADAGLVGMVLLVTAGISLIGSVRRRDVLTSCAAAALVCWAVAAGFDFDWHLPVVGLLGGWIAGLGAVGAALPQGGDRSGSVGRERHRTRTE